MSTNNRPLRIGLFCDTLSPQKNGVVTSCNAFADQLRTMGHQVFLFGPKLHGTTTRSPVYRFHCVPFPWLPEHKIVLPIPSGFRWSDIRKLNLDIVHIHTFFSAGWIGIAIARFLKIPMVFTYHTYYGEYTHYLPGPSRVTYRLNQRYTRTVCNWFPVTIVPTRIIRDILVGYGVTSTIHVLPSGLQLPPAQHPIDIYTAFKLPPDSTVLVTVSRLGKEKSIDEIIDAIAVVNRRHPTLDVHLLVIGDGPLRVDLAQRCRQLGIENRVRFLGYLEHPMVMSIMAAASLFVFASKTETQGMVIIETMACGTPVVAVDALGVGEILENPNGGLKVPEGQLAEGIIDLITDPTRYQAKKASTHQRAEDYNITRLTTQLVAIYRSMLPTTQTPSGPPTDHSESE